MTEGTAKLMEDYEAQGSGNAFAVMFDKKQATGNDGTHYNMTGALLAARLCAQLIQQEKDNYSSLATLAANINVPTDMSFNPSVANMGEVYVGQAATKEISLSALGLTPAEGSVTITATDGIQLSYDKVNWETSLTADYSMGTLIKTLYAKVAITKTGAFNGTVTATLGSKSVELPVSVTGIELGGGDPFTATWALSTNAQPTVTEGVSVTAANALIAGLQAKSYDSTNGVQIAENTAGAWNAALEDNNPNNYMEFSVTAPAGRTIEIANIAMKVKEQGGDHLHFHMFYSTDNFDHKESLYEFQAASDAWKEYSKTNKVTLDEGKTLKVRIYPWSDAVTTGNWLCVKDVVITGQSKDAAGVNIKGTITYKLDKGGLTQGDEVVISPNELTAGIAVKKWTAGTGIDVSGTADYVGATGEENVKQTKITSLGGTSSTAGKDNTLTLTLTPDYGYSFVPTKVSFEAARYGTSGGNISLTVAAGDAEENLLANKTVNGSGSSMTIAKFEPEVTGSITATSDNPLKLNFSFTSLGNGKAMGLSNLVIEGTLVGAPENVTKYQLSTVCSPAEAGTIERDPDREFYKEGSQVTLTATAKLGYKFTEWQDGNGNSVGTDATTTITMDGMKTMKAVYESVFVGVTLPNGGEDFDLNLATLTAGSVASKDGVNQFDGVTNNGSATFNLINTQPGILYQVKLNAATANKGNTLRLVITDKTTKTVELDETFSIEANGWQNFKEYSTITEEMASGEKEFVIHFLSGGGYTSNVNHITFTPVEGSVYRLTTECEPAEGGKVSPEGGKYLEGAEVNLTATANPYYTFQKWEDESTDAVRTLTMPEKDKTVTAYFAAAPLNIPTIDVNPFHIEWAECNIGNWNGSNLDSFKDGGSASYTITNTKDCAYILKYQAATQQDGVQIKMQIKQGSDVLFEKTQDIENTGNWQTYKDYELTTSALVQGEYTFVVNFLRADGGYTANVKDIQFKEDKPIVAGQILSVNIDGVALGESVFDPLVDKHATTISKSLTALPTISATFDGVDGPVSMSNVEPTIEGNTLTYVKNVSGTDYTFTFTNYHPYTATESDQTHAVSPGSGTSENNVWTDGTITMTFGGDWGFKMNNGEKTISMPTNWQVKQIIFAGTADNYNEGGQIASMTSEGATVYSPYNTTLKRSEDQDYIFNFDNHQAGTPVKFTVANCGQMYIRTVKIIYEEVAVATAPKVLSSTISDTEHKNHVVVTVNYDHAVTAAKATVGDKEAHVKGLGTTTVKYSVWDLDYEHDYTFTIAAGDLSDAYDNMSTEAFTKNFTVGTQLDNTVREADFDYIVSNMTELKAALDEVNESNKSKTAERKYIYLKNGTYDANEMATGTTEKEVQACQLRANYNVSLIGESRDDVVIIYTPFAEGMGERTITLGYGCYAQDITFKTGIPVGEGRGVALFTEGEHVIINNCAALGGQDTYLTGGTCYWKGGIIEGAVDFIFGGGDYLFDGTTLSVYSGGKVTAGAHSANTEWGYVFKDCTLKAADASTTDGSFSLGRPWQGEPRAIYINTDMQVLPVTNGWDSMSKLPTHYYEYNSTHNGQAVDLSKRFCGNSQNQTTAGTDYTLTAEQAAEYTMENIFGEVDGWYPAEEIPNVIKPGETDGIQNVPGAQFQITDGTPIYNLKGQRVNSSYRGLVIIGGRKVVLK